MVVVFTIKKIRHVVFGPFDDLVCPLRISICDIKFFGCAVCFHSAIV